MSLTNRSQSRRSDDLERLLGARGPTHAAEPLEQVREQRRDDLVILDEQDLPASTCVTHPALRLPS